MGTTFARALAAALLLPAIALAETTRVAVIAVGNDAAATGALQARVDRAIATQKSFVAIPRNELALRLAVGAPTVRDDGRLASLFAQAKEAYFDDRLDEASDRIDDASKLISEQGMAIPGSDRVTILTWRVGLALAKKDDAKADEHVKQLLALAPEAAPDLSTFRPSVGKFVDAAREKQPKPVEIKLEGAPAGARLEVDGRVVDTKFKIGPGKHVLALRAAGYRPAQFVFDASSDRVVALSPALDPGDKALGALQSAAWSDGPTMAPIELAQRLAVDALAVVASRPDGSMRAVLVHKGGTIVRSDAASGKDPENGIATWLASKLSSSPVAVATPRGAQPKPRSAGPIVLDAGLTFAQRSRSLEGDGGAGFDASFGGAGGFVDAEYRHRVVIAGLRAGWTSYGFSTATFDLPGGDEGSVQGGSTARGDLRVGSRVLGAEERFSLIAQGELVYESHTAEDLRTSSGDLGFFASYTRIAAGIGTRADVPVGSLRLHAGLSVHPFHSWTESPQKTGASPKGSPAIGLRAGAGVPMGTTWEVAGDYIGEIRSVSFSGGADVPITPAVQDATISEQVHSLSLTLRRRF